jgi:hypothetical protein
MLIVLLICIGDKKTVVSVVYAYIIQLILLTNACGMQRRAGHLCAIRTINE